MSLSSHNLFTNSPVSSCVKIKNPKDFCICPPISSRYFIHISNNTTFNFIPKFNFHHSLKPRNCHNESFTQQTHNNSNFDSLLSISELLCLFSSTIIAIGFVNYSVFGLKNTLLGLIEKRVLAFGGAGLVGGVCVGAIIRRRQWRRICWENLRGEGSENVNLVERIKKLEEDSKNSATIIRVLSRQLEKLGIRLRVTLKALKDHITETEALAQKNSEATRALAMQEDIIEKELGEIQKVLLAMQEQQQKQLELILAIGKTGKVFESRQEPRQVQNTFETSDLIDGTKQIETPETEALGSSRGSNNDRT